MNRLNAAEIIEQEDLAWSFLFPAGIGPYVEMAFFHRPTRTLLTTDAVIFVPQRPPAVRLLLSGLYHRTQRRGAAKLSRCNVYVCILGQDRVHVQEGTLQVVNEDNLMEAGGPLQASVRLLSGGDRDEDGKSTTPEAQPQNRAQQLQLGGSSACYQVMWQASVGTQRIFDALLADVLCQRPLNAWILDIHSMQLYILRLIATADLPMGPEKS